MDTSRKQKSSGFKWKDKRPRDVDDRKAPGSEGLHRGYRDLSPRRSDRYNDRERSPARDSAKDSDSISRLRDHSEREHVLDTNVEPSQDSQDKQDQPLESSQSDGIKQSTADKFGLPSKSEKKDKPKKRPRVTAPAEPMIVVNINDRLGTKAAIPCLASDSVKAFKAIVAAHIGRQPHEIMLKRQGERPFKDQLTLEDYGVSSGVQLDLEIDTGD